MNPMEKLLWSIWNANTFLEGRGSLQKQKAGKVESMLWNAVEPISGIRDPGDRGSLARMV